MNGILNIILRIFSNQASISFDNSSKVKRPIKIPTESRGPHNRYLNSNIPVFSADNSRNNSVKKLRNSKNFICKVTIETELRGSHKRNTSKFNNLGALRTELDHKRKKLNSGGVHLDQRLASASENNRK